MLSCALGYARTWRLVGSVAKPLPVFEFKVQIHESDISEEGKGNPIEWIEILSGGKTVQTIRFIQGDDAPKDFGEMKEIVSLKDVDCDGYKDLLVRKSVGIAANAWYYLYRYQPSSHSFVLYPGFDELPFESVNCRMRRIYFHNNSGLAGCVYEDSSYQWVNGKLNPEIGRAHV